MLRQRVDGRITFGGTNLSGVVSYLASNAGFKFEIPNGLGEGRVRFAAGNEALAVTLARACDVFGVTYDVDASGKLIFKKGAKGDPLPDRLYWLQAGSFPADKPADEVLKAKGIDFPQGASAVWDAASSRLRVVNTEANLAKVADVLKKDFGATLSSPSHWLMLASGGRLALSVERFDKDNVTGTHPVFGRCTVPLSQVVGISTTAPVETPVMRAVSDWRLAYAPEPVLPETGGDSSALQGKDAPDFKLPLVSGGQFDLSKEKGKVVVLDFWATWCGPCVHSMPELITALSPFPADKVELIGVDQDEAVAQVKQFITARQWNLTAAIDTGSEVGRKYGADSIPLTVIVGPDGKIAGVHSGYTPGGADEIAKMVQAALDGAGK
jgi:peroxiredoxin